MEAMKLGAEIAVAVWTPSMIVNAMKCIEFYYLKIYFCRTGGGAVTTLVLVVVPHGSGKEIEYLSHFKLAGKMRTNRFIVLNND